MLWELCCVILWAIFGGLYFGAKRCSLSIRTDGPGLLRTPWVTDSSGRFAGQLRRSIRLCIKFLLTFSAVAIGDLFPGLIDIVERFFLALSCSPERRRCAHRVRASNLRLLELASRFPEPAGPTWHNNVEIRDRVGFLPTLVYPLFNVPVPTGGKYSSFMAGCTPVQPVTTLKKAFFLLAMNARKSSRFFLFG